MRYIKDTCDLCSEVIYEHESPRGYVLPTQDYIDYLMVCGNCRVNTGQLALRERDKEARDKEARDKEAKV